MLMHGFVLLLYIKLIINERVWRWSRGPREAEDLVKMLEIQYKMAV